MGTFACSHTASETTATLKPSEPHAELRREYRQMALRNSCPAGVPRLQGTWHFIGESKTPDFRSTFTVQGTKFHETLDGKPDGKSLQTNVSGEVRCLFKNRVLFMVDKVLPEGGFGNRSGDEYACDILDAMEADTRRILLICFFDWDMRPAKGLSFEYERRQ